MTAWLLQCMRTCPGYHCQKFVAELRADKEEVGIEGWNTLDNCYAFQYADTTGIGVVQPCPLLPAVLCSSHWVVGCSFKTSLILGISESV